MILINERFSINKGARCWELNEKKPTLSKKAKKEFSVDTTFWPTLQMCLIAVIDKCVDDDLPNVEAIASMIQLTKQDIKIALEGMNK